MTLANLTLARLRHACPFPEGKGVGNSGARSVSRLGEAMAERVVKGSRTSDGKVMLARAFHASPTPAEHRLWRELHDNRFVGLHFRRQQVIDGFIADLYCHAVALVIEVDGEIHDQQQDYDDSRSLAFAARGIRVLRVTNTEVLRNMPRVLTRIFAAVENDDGAAASDES